MKTITYDETSWRLVPLELTVEMMKAASNWVGWHAWAPMLAAAPQAPQDETPDAVEYYGLEPWQAPVAPASAGLPERGASKPAEVQGLFRKFDVRRVDGSDQPGGKHYGCRYYVLDVDHDVYAAAALTVYAAACEATHPELARDLRKKWGAAPSPQGDAGDTQLLDWLREECCDLRCINVPTGGDDYEVRWVVIEHHMAKPHEREIGRSFTDDPRDAIRAARRTPAKGGE